MILQNQIGDLRSNPTLPYRWFSTFADYIDNRYDWDGVQLGDYHMPDTWTGTVETGFTWTIDDPVIDDKWIAHHWYGTAYVDRRYLTTPAPTNAGLTIILTQNVSSFTTGYIWSTKDMSLEKSIKYWYISASKTQDSQGFDYLTQSFSSIGTPLDAIKIQNPQITLPDQTVTNSSTIYFDFANGATLSSSVSNIGSKLVHGTGSKLTRKYTFYLDHQELKDLLTAQADSYTTITLYHLDGTAWT